MWAALGPIAGILCLGMDAAGRELLGMVLITISSSGMPVRAEQALREGDRDPRLAGLRHVPP